MVYIGQGERVESLVVMGLLSAAPADTEPKKMLAKPTSRMLAELKRFEPKTTKKWLENGDFLIVQHRH